MHLAHALVLASLAASAAAQPSLVRLVAVADASADADQPATNFGSALLVTSGKTFVSTPTFRVWMTRGHYLFDLSSVTGLPLPTRARLRVYQETSSAAGCLDVTAHRVTQAWSEASLTWQNKPTHDPTEAARACVGDSFAPGFKSFDVTAVVHAWLQASAPNHGLVVRDPTESAAGAARPLHATSREATAVDRHPCLELAWDTLPFGTGCGPTSPVPTLDLETGTPALGDTYTLLAAELGRNSTVVHMLGASNTTWNGLSLPFNLAILGYPSCNLFVSPDLFLAGGSSDARGEARLPITVPNRPVLRGRRLYHQTLAIDSNQVLLFTNGYVVRVF